MLLFYSHRVWCQFQQRLLLEFRTLSISHRTSTFCKGCGWIVRSSATTGDLDGDIEILIGGDDDRLWAWHHDGQLVSGWLQQTGADLFSSPRIGDVYSDRNSEVIVRSDNARVYAWHTDVTLVEGWPRQTSLSVKGTLAMENLNGDLEQEVIAADRGGSLYVRNNAGMQQHFLPLVRN